MASRIAAADPGALPPATRHATRRALLDALGVMSAATGLAADAMPYRTVAVAAGTGPCALVSAPDRVAPAAAALANGALAHALDFGDVYDAGPAHPNAALVPALIALAQTMPGVRGHAFLDAMAWGSDLACRLSHAPARPYEDGGWYPPPLVGTIGAAAGCAKLLGLDADGIVAAIGLALCQAAFPGEIKYDQQSPLRGVREAFAARAAVEAALLARAGARAFAAPLEGKGGFLALYGGGARDGWLDGHGTAFLGDRVSFKPWPSCRGTHAYIEAALALRPQIGDAAIAEIVADTGPVQRMLIQPLPEKVAPPSPIAAKFSIPTTVALALAHGAVTLDSFAADALADPAVTALAARVRDRPDPDWGRADAARGALTILTADGRRLHHAVPQAAGHPDHPLSDAALTAKFVDCRRHAANGGSAHDEALAARILTLGDEDIGPLLASL